MMRFWGLFVVTLLFFANANSHHAATGLYERDIFGEIEGEILSIFWRNPHVRFLLSVRSENDEVESWEIEFGSVNTLERIGVVRDMINIGDRISIYGRMGREGRKAMFAGAITLANNEELALNADIARRYSIERATPRDLGARLDPKIALLKVWVPTDNRPRTGYGNTQYPLTEAGQAAIAVYDASQDPALRCIPPGIPTAMDNPYPIQFITQGEDLVLLLEEWDGIRYIQMTGQDNGNWRSHPRMGHSIGRWEGNSLRIRTTDIGWRFIDDLGTPQSEISVIEERFTVSSDGTQLAWVAQITDPINFTEPIIMEALWIAVPGNELKPFNCALSE
ncbi:MAG: hypothetical protein CMM56_09525 [Rhodospirillaceae bacterium]|nr:hypothetical protein [Rhodospirillaceae bacterium]